MEKYNTQTEHHGLDSIEKVSRLVGVHKKLDTLENQKTILKSINRDCSDQEKVSKYSKEELEKYKLDRLKIVVESAYKNVPFYRELYANAGYEPGSIESFKDFEALPIIRKKDIKNVPIERFYPDGHNNYTQKIVTSGSSGTPLELVADIDCILENTHGLFWQIRQMTGKKLNEDRWIYNIHCENWWLSSLLGKYRTFTLPKILCVDQFREHLEALKPQVIFSLPSYLPELIKVKDVLRKAGTELIVTNSEHSSRKERERASKLIGIPVLDEFSSEEVGTMAFECRYRNYHTMDSTLYVETIRSRGGEIGRIITTEITEGLMPMIRYDHGDLGVVNHNIECECGLNFSILENLSGRSDDAFLTKDGCTITTGDLLNSLDTVIREISKEIEDYQCVQNSFSYIEFRFTSVNGRDISDSLKSSIKKVLSDLFEDEMKIKFCCLRSIPQESGYKRKQFVRNF